MIKSGKSITVWVWAKALLTTKGGKNFPPILFYRKVCPVKQNSSTMFALYNIHTYRHEISSKPATM